MNDRILVTYFSLLSSRLLLWLFPRQNVFSIEHLREQTRRYEDFKKTCMSLSGNVVRAETLTRHEFQCIMVYVLRFNFPYSLAKDKCQYEAGPHRGGANGTKVLKPTYVLALNHFSL